MTLRINLNALLWGLL